MKALSTLVLSAAVVSAHATTFQLVPLTLDNGYTIKGSIDSDGTTGYLGTANLSNWTITVTQTTDVVYTDTSYTPPASEATTVVVTSLPEVSGVSSNGRQILVARSPDALNYADGGSLLMRGPGLYEPSWAMVADFTSYSAWYSPESITGGVGGWATALGIFLGAPLTSASCRTDGSCSNYIAATTLGNQPNVFRLVPVTVQSTKPQKRLFGTLTTDGTVGPLAPANFKAWRITGRTQDIQTYTPTNSQIRTVVGLYTDNKVLRADNNPNGNLGTLDIGTLATVNNPGLSVKLADFADPSFPGGVASVSYGNFGLLASKSPLTARRTYLVAKLP